MRPDYVFEISNEAGNKIGGIYTVLQSKSREVIKELHGNYYLISYYNPDNYKKEIIPDEPPEDFKKVFKELEEQGIKTYYGTWVEGSGAKIIMIEPYECCNKTVENEKNINIIKKQLWEEYGIDSLNAPEIFNEHAGWGWTTGILIQKLLQLPRFKNKTVIAHFHEWLSATGLLYLKKNKVKVATVFTTHATTLGRTLTNAGYNVIQEAYAAIKQNKTINDEKAYEHGVQAQHSLEKAAAKNADVFTTVSMVTGIESQYILGKKPDIITPNGIDIERFGKLDELLKIHKNMRNKVYTFLRSYFLPYYSTKIYHTPIFYLASRYEVRVKGINIFIDALAQLNNELKNMKYKNPIIALILVPTITKGVKPSVANNYEAFKKIEAGINESLEKTREKIITQLIRGEQIEKSCEIEPITQIKNLFLSIEKDGETPPISAYELENHDDLILKMLKEKGLTNKEEDVVKIVYYPTYVNEQDGLLQTKYYDLLLGLDVGVFPSIYEPWGLTPVEAASLLNVSITTDQAGFGRFIKDNNLESNGLHVLTMEKTDYWQVVNQLVDKMKLIALSSRDDLEEMKFSARHAVEITSWNNQIKYYFQAYEKAVEKIREWSSKNTT